MRNLSRFWLAAVLVLIAAGSVADAGVRIGIGIGLPFPGYWGPYYYPGYYYAPYPAYVAPTTYVVQPAPVTVLQTAPASTPTYQTSPYQGPSPTPISSVPAPPAPAPATAPVVARSVSSEEPPANADYYLDQLRSTDERVRSEAALQLGRMKERRAVAYLTQAVTNDRSPSVRDAAARGLGLIADPSTLYVLQRAAQADEDRDVRHSASFAADIIRTNLRGR